MRAFFAAGALLAVSCVPAIELELGAIPGVKTTIVGIIPPGEEPTLSVIDHRAGPRAFVKQTIRTGSVIFALHYTMPIFELDLEAGPLPLVGAGRLIPAWDRGERLDAGDESGSWTALDEDLVERIALLQIANIGFLECAAQEGCVSDAESTACLRPCPGPFTPPAPPAPAMLPIVPTSTCPGGELGIVRASRPGPLCEPPPLEPCPPGQIRFPKTQTCESPQRPCPPGQYASDLPASGVIYVLDGAPPGGSGDEMNPVGTIPDALEIATPGSIVALSKGSFSGPILLPADITLWGACAPETQISVTATTGVAVVNAAGRGAIVKRVTLARGGPSVLVSPGTSLHLDDVIIEGPGNGGVLAFGAELSSRDLVIRDRSGVSLGLEDGARSGPERIVRTYIERSNGIGIHVSPAGSSGVFDDLVVDGAGVAGVHIALGGTATIAFARVAGANLGAYLAGEPGSFLRLEDSEADGRGLSSFGIAAADGGRIGGARLTIEHIRGDGVTAVRRGRAALSEVVVRDGAASGEQLSGRGVAVSDGASMTITDLLVARCLRSAIVGAGPDATGTVDHAHLRDTQVQREATGRGMRVVDGASISLSTALIENNVGGGVASNDGTIALTDVIIRGSLRIPGNPEHDLIQAVGNVALTRVAVYDSPAVAVRLDRSKGTVRDLTVVRPDQAAIDLADADLRLSAVDVSDGGGTCFGIAGSNTKVELEDFSASRCRLGGLDLDASLEAKITRAMISACSGFGMRIEGRDLDLEETLYTFDDVSITDTSTSAGGCAGSPDCPTAGLRVENAPAMEVRRFAVERSASIGVWINLPHETRLADGIVVENATGLRITTQIDDDPNVRLLLDRVHFSRNGRNARLDRLTR